LHYHIRCLLLLLLCSLLPYACCCCFVPAQIVSHSSFLHFMMTNFGHEASPLIQVSMWAWGLLQQLCVHLLSRLQQQLLLG
jgi:hypothetical protein